MDGEPVVCEKPWLDIKQKHKAVVNAFIKCISLNNLFFAGFQEEMIKEFAILYQEVYLSTNSLQHQLDKPLDIVMII